MGNCCPRSEEQQTLTTTSSGRRVQAFQGEGHRLGTADEEAQYATATANDNMDRDDMAPSPSLDPNVTDEERAKIRADRAAAAEARLKKQGGGKSNARKKKTDGDAPPLRGPNSEPLMRWTA